MRELEDYEIEATITTALCKDDILNLEIINGKQLDTIDLLRFAKLSVSIHKISECLEMIKNLKQ